MTDETASPQGSGVTPLTGSLPGGKFLTVAEVAAIVDELDRLLVETDAPFLTPEPFRGRPNASFLIPLTVRFMAGIVGDSVEELCRSIRKNTEQAFGGPWPEWV